MEPNSSPLPLWRADQHETQSSGLGIISAALGPLQNLMQQYNVMLRN